MTTTRDHPTTPPSDARPRAADLDCHLAAALFPLLPADSDEFGELVRDLQEHGLLQRIVLHEGHILDGRSRYRACQHAGIEARFEEWSGESPTAYVLSLNPHRRHLTDGQRAAIAAEAKGALRGGGARAEARPRQHGARAAERERRSDVRAAKEVGVSRCAIRQAERIKEADPSCASWSGPGQCRCAKRRGRSSAGNWLRPSQQARILRLWSSAFRHAAVTPGCPHADGPFGRGSGACGSGTRSRRAAWQGHRTEAERFGCAGEDPGER